MPDFGNPVQAAGSEGLLKKTHLLKTTTVWHETAGMNDRMTPLTIEIQRPGSICRLELTSVRVATIDGGAQTYRIRATAGVFHQAIREIDRVPQMPRQTSFRIWKTPLIAVRVVGHGGPAFSKLRRSGWMQRTLKPECNACSQLLGSFTWQSEKGR